MSGETADKESGWTVDTLKEYVEAKISGVNKTSALFADLSKTAQDKFEASVRGEFVKVNEFRGALEDLGKNMATRRELETAIANKDDQMNKLIDRVNSLQSRIDTGPPALQTLQTQQDISQGRTMGANALWGYVLGAIGLIATVLSIFTILSRQ